MCRCGLKVLMLVWAVWSLVDCVTGAVAWLRKNDLWIKLELVCGWWMAASSSSHSICQGVVRRPKMIWSYFLEDLFEWEKQLWLVRWLYWVCVCDWLNSMSSALAGGKDAELTFSSLVWWWGRRPHAAGRETNPTSPPVSSEPGRQLDFWLLLVFI